MTSSAPAIQPRRAQFRKTWSISLIAGLVVLALTLLSATQPPVRPCGPLRPGYAPIIAFELARTEADLHALFGTSEPCRSTVIARMDSMNWTDVLVFIPFYGVFMAFFFLGMRARDARLATWGLRVTIAALAAPAALGPAIGLAIGASWLVYLVAAAVGSFSRNAVVAAQPEPPAP